MTQDDQLNVGVLLYIPYRAMENRVLEKVRAAGFDNVTLAQARLLQRVGASGSRLTDLAEQAQVTKQTAGVLVDALERSGYVERVPDPSDGRARLVRFTATGVRATEIANAAVTDVETEWTRHLGTQQMGQLRRALASLREITDPYD